MIYHYQLADGQEGTIDVSCAADAIQGALQAHPGQTVAKCWRGEQGKGRINYDVPRHDPLPPAAPRPRVKDNTAGMFDDAQIKAESEAARIRTNPQAED